MSQPCSANQVLTRFWLYSAACSALDKMNIPEIVGTLAGDDTVLLVFHDSAHAADFCEQVRQMLR